MQYIKYVIDRTLEKAVHTAIKKVNESQGTGTLAEFYRFEAEHLSKLKQTLKETKIPLDEEEKPLLETYLSTLKAACSETNEANKRSAEELRKLPENEGIKFPIDRMESFVNHFKRLIDDINSDFNYKKKLYFEHQFEDHQQYTGEQEDKDWLKCFVNLRMAYKAEKLADIYINGASREIYNQKIAILDETIRAWNDLLQVPSLYAKEIDRLTKQNSKLILVKNSLDSDAQSEEKGSLEAIINENESQIKEFSERAIPDKARDIFKIQGLLNNCYEREKGIQLGKQGPHSAGFMSFATVKVLQGARAIGYARGTLNPMLQDFIGSYNDANRPQAPLLAGGGARFG